FFFQAEDGIRDKLVTGVQTCALPIYELDHGALALAGVAAAEFFAFVPDGCQLAVPDVAREADVEEARSGDFDLVDDLVRVLQVRSEERRVGKEYRSRV